MLFNYLKVSFRNIFRNKIFSSINILGLSIGMAACLLIMLWVQNELNFDRFHEKRDQIYRVMSYGQDYMTEGSEAVPGRLAIAATPTRPEIEAYAIFEGIDESLFEYDNRGYYLKNGLLADTGFFQFFNFEFAEGNINQGFKNPNEIIINEEIAHTLFGSESGINKIIKVDGEAMKVIGIMKKAPGNSTLDFNFVVPFNHGELNSSRYSWGRLMFTTFIRLNPHANIDSIASHLTNIAKENECPQVVRDGLVFKLQALKDVHLDGKMVHGAWRDYYVLTDKSFIIAFSIIALFILINAAFNYINLSTARSERRSKEVAVRKVSGAQFGDLFRQFIGESLLISFISIIISLIILELARPVFSDLTQKPIIIDYSSLAFIGSVLGLLFFTGLLAGSYPAIVLSSYNPLRILRKSYQNFGSGIFRNTLVIIQFLVASILIIGSVIIIRQLNYWNNKELGFDNSNIICVPFKENLAENYHFIKTELLQDPNILSITASDYLWANNENRCAGCFAWEGFDWDNPQDFHTPLVDFDYFKTLSIKTVSGRDFSSAISSDSTMAVMVNETGAKKIGIDDVTSLPATYYSFSSKKRISVQIIGVYEDIFYGSLHKEIEPQVVRIANAKNDFYEASHMLIKVNPNNTEAVIGKLEKHWNDVNSLIAFEYFFLDQAYEDLYQKDRDSAWLIIYFTFFSILIACLGILGLSIFIAERKTKEIGIRKVNGANTFQLIMTVLGKFMLWIGIAFLIAIPSSYLLMEEVLQNYSYRVNIGVQDYFISFLLIVIVSVGSSIYQAIKGARMNPVDSLRYD